MNLQKFKKASVLIFSAFFILKSTFVSAGVTHTAKIEMGLSVVNGSGTITEVQNMNGDFSLDWSNGKCELKVKNLYVYCSLNTKQNLKDKDGSALVNAMPIVHFDSERVDGIILLLGLANNKTAPLIQTIVTDTSSSRSLGLELPFYTCGECEKVNGKTPVKNAFDDSVEVSLRINHALLKDQSLVLKLKLHHLKAVKGAFNMTGSRASS